MKWNAMAWYEMQSADKQRNGSTDKEHGYRRKMQLLTRAKGEKRENLPGLTSTFQRCDRRNYQCQTTKPAKQPNVKR